MILVKQNPTKFSAVLATVLEYKIALYVKTRNFHWTISDFNGNVSVHKILEQQYRKLEQSICDLSVYIGKPHVYSLDKVTDSNMFSDIVESTENKISSIQVFEELLSDHSLVINQLRQTINNVVNGHPNSGITNFLIKQLEVHESIDLSIRKYLNWTFNIYLN